ncbi:calcium/sodium antiporter [Leisingera aquaemixtae]|uniref:calcium/sodium antiporter n=1 Tax=Leisingera aquaemixtae TaxID=1396826 RepID=UPI001C987F6C|nr:calcium/sodium antiporter [Leisingera aquaemixtae]MBY6067673.1 calcium/sodium antiporter [Leisingera aquaemixtae]
MFDIWLPLLGGLALLILGGEFLVRGAVRVAERFGISPLVIGLTLVGFGTSAPELVTSVRAALAGAPGIAYGNITGSNIANILLIAGLSALIAPIAVQSAALRRDGGVMLAATAVFAALAATVPVTRLAGLSFVLVLAAYVWFAIRQERTTAADHGALYDKAAALEGVDPAITPESTARRPLWRPLATALGGLALVIGGGGMLVDGAVELARMMQVSETVIGLTIVAVGTSAPELATSVAAALRRQGEMAFGNIIGSNIYNLLGIGGATAMIAPSEVPERIAGFDNPLMLLVTVAFLGLAWTGLRVSRREGAALLAGYGAYVWWLWPA